MSETKYDKSLDTSVLKTLAANLYYQAIAEAEGITVTIDDYKSYLLELGQTEDDFNSMVETYGEKYLIQNMLAEKAIDVIKENVVLE